MIFEETAGDLFIIHQDKNQIQQHYDNHHHTQYKTDELLKSPQLSAIFLSISMMFGLLINSLKLMLEKNQPGLLPTTENTDDIRFCVKFCIKTDTLLISLVFEQSIVVPVKLQKSTKW